MMQSAYIIKINRSAVWRALFVFLAMLATLSLSVPTAMAEGGQSKRPAASAESDSKPPVGIKTGDKCKRRTDDIPGVVKQDGCGRWYCGRADVKDIVELVPNIEEVAHCKWQLQGSRCLCVKTGAKK